LERRKLNFYIKQTKTVRNRRLFEDCGMEYSEKIVEGKSGKCSTEERI
jgi:hypothetical protein